MAVIGIVFLKEPLSWQRVLGLALFPSPHFLDPQ
jgi:multidrug transporter EmrE-like cation transporter